MLSLGIIGLPNVGKSTLFKALTRKAVDISNYPFTTIGPNVGVVAVPDERLETLGRLVGSAKVIPAAIEFIDIAGLIKGAAEGEGLGNKFLAHIRECDAIVQVVRVFEDKNITHVHGRIDPQNDVEVIRTELILADGQTVEKRLEANAHKIKTGEKTMATEQVLLQKIGKSLEEEIPFYQMTLDEKERERARSLNLLTAKKTVYVFNASEEQVKNRWQPSPKLLKTIEPSAYAVLSANFELLISETIPEEKNAYLAEAGLTGSGLDELISKSYRLLELITFFTANENEARAWTIKKNTLVPRAAGMIHTDFEKSFIRAEVINWQELIKAEGRLHARESGTLKLVGHDYLVQEGDVVEIKI